MRHLPSSGYHAPTRTRRAGGATLRSAVAKVRARFFADAHPASDAACTDGRSVPAVQGARVARCGVPRFAAVLLVALAFCMLVLAIPRAAYGEDGGSASERADGPEVTVLTADTDATGADTEADTGTDATGTGAAGSSTAASTRTGNTPDTAGKIGAAKVTARDFKLGASDVQLISVTDLVGASLELDDQKFQFSGEAVGDIIHAGSGYAWVTVTDGAASLSVYLKEADAQRIINLGRYQVEGSTVLVSGDFHLACDVHDGETDVHATSLSVLRAGGMQPVQADLTELYRAIALIALGLVLMFVYWRLRERLR